MSCSSQSVTTQMAAFQQNLRSGGAAHQTRATTQEQASDVTVSQRP